MATRKLKPGMLASRCIRPFSICLQSGKHPQVAAESVKAVLLYQQQGIDFIQYAMVEKLLQPILRNSASVNTGWQAELALLKTIIID